MAKEPRPANRNGGSKTAREEGGVPWLVMVYMAGDNSLTEEMVLGLSELTAEQPRAEDLIVVQYNPGGTGLATQRYIFSRERGTELEELREPDFDGLEVNTGSPVALERFMKWAMGLRPRHEDRRTMLVLSGHGSGTTQDFLLKDESAADSMTFGELTSVISSYHEHYGRKLDVLGLDACYMCMGELAYELRDDVEFLVGPEGLEPAFGWPYRRIVRRMREADESMAPEALATAIVKEYVETYRNYDSTAGRSADLAALRAAGMRAVTGRFRSLVAKLPRSESGDAKVLLAHWYAQTYKADQFVDLKDLCTQLQKQFPRRPGIRDACTAVADAVASCVVISGCSGFATQHSWGVSIYFPWSVIAPDTGSGRSPKPRAGWTTCGSTCGTLAESAGTILSCGQSTWPPNCSSVRGSRWRAQGGRPPDSCPRSTPGSAGCSWDWASRRTESGPLPRARPERQRDAAHWKPR